MFSYSLIFDRVLRLLVESVEQIGECLRLRSTAAERDEGQLGGRELGSSLLGATGGEDQPGEYQQEPNGKSSMLSHCATSSWDTSNLESFESFPFFWS